MSDHSQTFGKLLQRWIDEREGMSASQLAKAMKMSRAYVGYLLSDRNPATNKPIQVNRVVADKIADALGRSRAEVREAVGLSAFDPGHASKPLDEEGERLLRFFSELPHECQLDVLALIEGLWKRRRAEGRAEKLKTISRIKRPSSTPDEETDAQRESPQRKRRA